MADFRVVRVKDFAMVLEDAEVQAVIVSTPYATHEDFCIQSMRAGKGYSARSQ